MSGSLGARFCHSQSLRPEDTVSQAVVQVVRKPRLVPALSLTHCVALARL